MNETREERRLKYLGKGKYKEFTQVQQLWTRQAANTTSKKLPKTKTTTTTTTTTTSTTTERMTSATIYSGAQPTSRPTLQRKNKMPGRHQKQQRTSLRAQANNGVTAPARPSAGGNHRMAQPAASKLPKLSTRKTTRPTRRKARGPRPQAKQQLPTTFKTMPPRTIQTTTTRLMKTTRPAPADNSTTTRSLTPPPNTWTISAYYIPRLVNSSW